MTGIEQSIELAAETLGKLIKDALASGAASTDEVTALTGLDEEGIEAVTSRTAQSRRRSRTRRQKPLVGPDGRAVTLGSSVISLSSSTDTGAQWWQPIKFLGDGPGCDQGASWSWRFLNEADYDDYSIAHPFAQAAVHCGRYTHRDFGDGHGLTASITTGTQEFVMEVFQAADGCLYLILPEWKSSDWKYHGELDLIEEAHVQSYSVEPRP